MGIISGFVPACLALASGILPEEKMGWGMGNARGEKPQYGGSTPRVPDLAGTFNLAKYNQPKEIVYCAGVDSDVLTPGNAEKTAQEFERYVKTPQCVGLKIYLGYNAVYAYDPVHFPLYELAQHYNIPVAFHTGDLAGGHVFCQLRLHGQPEDR